LKIEWGALYGSTVWKRAQYGRSEKEKVSTMGKHCLSQEIKVNIKGGKSW